MVAGLMGSGCISHSCAASSSSHAWRAIVAAGGEGCHYSRGGAGGRG